MKIRNSIGLTNAALLFAVLLASCATGPGEVGSATVRYEAEDAAIKEPAIIWLDFESEWYVEDASGGTYADDFWKEGAGAFFTVDVLKAGVYQLVLRYTSGQGGDGTTISLVLNDESRRQIRLPDTGSWFDWDTITFDLELSEGRNTVGLVHSDVLGDRGGIKLDYVEFVGPEPVEPYYYATAPEVLKTVPLTPEHPLAQAVRGTPEIDGEMDEAYEQAPAIPVDKVIRDQPVNEAVSAVARALWDEEAFYLFVEVIDPDVVLDEDQFFSPWERDSIEVYVDEQNERNPGDYDDNDYQYIVDALGNTHAGSDGLRGASPRLYESADQAVVLTDTGYIIELRLPWQTDVGAGDTIGFDIKINARDQFFEKQTELRFGTAFDVAAGHYNAYSNPEVFALLELQ
jgi:hypothetical protein